MILSYQELFTCMLVLAIRMELQVPDPREGMGLEGQNVLKGGGIESFKIASNRGENYYD